MISLTCTHCKQVLKIDDAFAGGVCRCQHCGTIQTVPVKAREGAGTGNLSAAGKPKPQKALFQHKSKSASGAPVQGSGLDELAQIVASSGLGGSGLTRGSLRTTQTKKSSSTSGSPADAGAKKKRMMIVGASAAGVLLLSVVGFLVFTHSSDSNPDGVPRPQPGGTPSVSGNSPTFSPSKSSGPNFIGMPLAGKSVVYVIDRGGGTKEAFSDLLELTLKSVESLGPDRKFQILFWDNGTDPLAYPAVTLSSATPANTAEARTKLQDAYAFGQSDYAPALKNAFARAPDAVVVATGKGYDLDEAFIKAVDTGRGSAGVKVYTLAINGSGGSNALQQVAQKTGGVYREMSSSELRSANQ